MGITGLGTINITGTLNNTSLSAPNGGGIFTLSGGTISGGTVNSGALAFSSGGGILSGVSMPGAFSLPSSAAFTANSNTTFSGGTTTFASNTVHVNGSGNALTIASDEAWTGNMTLSAQTAGVGVTNNGAWTNTTGTNFIYGGGQTGFAFTNNGTVSATSGTLNLGDAGTDAITNGSTGTIEANGGTVTLATGGGTITVANAGLLEATGAGSTVNLGINANTAWTNTGTILATNNGVVNLGGTFSTANLTSGTVGITGLGTINITGTLNNTTLAPPDGGGIFTLSGGTISGGTVNSGALTFSSGAGTLSGVAMVGSYSAPATASFTANSNTTFSGGTTTFASNTVHLNGSGIALTIASDETWTGNMTLSAQAAGIGFTNNGAWTNASGTNFIYGGGQTGFTFTNNGTVSAASGTLNLGDAGTDAIINGSTGTIEANGGIVTLATGGGTITVANAGLLEATGAGSTVNLGINANTAWTNTGTILATNNGVVNLGGTFSTANLTSGTVGITGLGTINITGTLNNTTLAPPDGGGIFTLSGGTISGGTVNSGALTFSSGAGTLSGVAMVGSYSAPATASFTANSNTTFSGGTTTFASNTVHLNGAGNALTLASDETWTGNMTISAQATGLGLINNGTFTLTSGVNYIYGGGQTGFTFTNNGTVDATSGTLNVGDAGTDAITNAPSGVFDAAGGNVTFGLGGATVTNLSGNTLSGGTWMATNGGTLLFTGASSTITTNGAATVLILNGAGSNIESGPSNHTLEQTLATNNGTLEVLNGRNFASSSAGIANNGTIQLGGGTFTASSLTNNPGSMLSGSGTFGPTGGVAIGSGVVVAPGNPGTGTYVNTLSFSTPLTLGPAGAGIFDIQNASGAAGTGYDSINATGAATISATPVSPFKIYVESINPGTGNLGLATFNMAQSYQWTLLSAGSISGFSASDFTIDGSLFANSLGAGYFFVSADANDVYLNFTPVPEPSTWALIAGGAAIFGFACWKRRPVRVCAVVRH